ncbi:hypothetical protein B9J93_22380 [Vibrio sp. V17_P4S1T151]|uniref:RecQ family ATP-dependent DNA helicase n=1 Tax=unclassified Vibrio TaxID=2614977 RepID=UPI000B8E9313|nr:MULTISPECIES: RecQ family ATP-dependent DNA helicase [unclassified Vibrio]OXX40374.1 hypothetical protein B9J93_22380 [Vibrio sp. V17_P4S1T151]OXX64928.1 hypothetical protein B9J89_03360 [Vibrio sp. V15_P4S5T153]
MNKDPSQILKEYWGYDGFRPGQAEIVDNVISGKDSLAIMTTGGGKSICFQVPALALDGTCVVISPLISLMKDQVDNLLKRNIPATYINSSLEPQEIFNRVRLTGENAYKLVYMAPERLEDEKMLEALARAKISFIAIDEAHCASLWGHDFRAAYSRINDSLQKIESVQNRRIPRAAYTATATERVREDILQTLGMEDPYIQVGNFDRPNIRFHVKEPNSKTEALTELLDHHKGQDTIIYVPTVKLAETLGASLNSRGLNVGVYHGKLTPEQKNSVQDAFIESRLKTIVATNAFGMGVDKPTVRAVIHFNMPQNLENYYQEAGRAGRDGKDSDAYLLYSKKDRVLNEFFIATSYPTIANVIAVRNALFQLVGDRVDYMKFETISDFVAEKISAYEVQSIMNILEDQGVIKMKGSEGDYLGVEVSIENIEAPLDLDYLQERRKTTQAALNTMERYCQTKLCKRTAIMKYFGDSHQDNCGTCSSCLEKSLEGQKISKYSDEDLRAALSLIEDTNGQLTTQRYADILVGLQKESLIRRNYEQLNQFGLLKQMTTIKVKRLMEDMIDDQIIHVSKMEGNYKITPKGKELLEGKSQERVISDFGTVKKSNEAGVMKVKQIYDPELYKVILEKRSLLAMKRSYPPHMIFSDRAARKLATIKPLNKESMAQCDISDQRIRMYGDDIIATISGYISLNNIDAPFSDNSNAGKEEAEKSPNLNVEHEGNDVHVVETSSVNGLMTLRAKLAQTFDENEMLIFSENVAKAISEKMPTSIDDLTNCGMTLRRAKKYGKYILQEINKDNKKDSELEI